MMSLRTRLLAACVIVATLVDCTLFIGDTDGYHADPASADSGTGKGSGGASVELGCASVADCDAGQACCLNLTSTSVATQCQTGPCGGAVPIQVCKDDQECAGVACLPQQCERYAIRACGPIAVCTAR
jgi:hypothetical protein